MVEVTRYGGILADVPKKKSKVQISPGQIPLGSPIPLKKILWCIPKGTHSAPVAGDHLHLLAG